jgi:hypothetical protein
MLVDRLGGRHSLSRVDALVQVPVFFRLAAGHLALVLDLQGDVIVLGLGLGLGLTTISEHASAFFSLCMTDMQCLFSTIGAFPITATTT